MTQNKNSLKNDIFYSLKCGIASLIATSISVSLLQPFELIKVRFQSHDGQANSQNLVPKYRGITGALRQIVAQQGFAGLFKGLSVTVMSAAVSSSLFFTFYQKRKKSLLFKQNISKKQQMFLITRAAIEAGIGVICFTQPLWVIKTRMLLNTKKDIKQTSNIYQTIKQIYHQHGLQGFYKGFSVNLFLSSNRAFQMFFYQGSKNLYSSFQIPQSNLMEKNFICGGISKIGSVLLIYPLTTLRTRIIQNQYVKEDSSGPKYRNVTDVIIKTFQKQGIKGFYKGITANMIRGLPERSIFFYCYEIIKKMILGENGVQ